MSKAKYVLVDDYAEVSEVFDSLEELEDFLEDEGYDEDTLDDVRVFEIDTEYRVVHNKDYDLEEV